VHLLTTLADQAAIAIENARLFRAAERERAKLGTILREMQDVVIVTDDELRIILANAAACEAFQLNDTAIGQPLAEVVAVQPLIDQINRDIGRGFVATGVRYPAFGPDGFPLGSLTIAGVSR
jgi:PAS domain-containing protein